MAHLIRIISNVLWAVIMLLWAPFRGIFRTIFSLFICKTKRSMEDEIVLVTGSAQGLGRGISIEMARLGATVVCWDINESGNQETLELATQVSPKKGSVFTYRCDVSKREEVMAAAELLRKQVGNVTMLINNAGIITAGKFETYKHDAIVRVVNTNFLSHFWTIEAFLPHMKSVNSGQIVCISSMAALTPTEYMVPYSATKCAITGLMDSLGEELLCLGYDKIQITTVHPFFINTNSTMNGFHKTQTGPEMLMPANGVVKAIVEGVLEKRRDFSIPASMLPLIKIAKLYPRDVIRSCKNVTLGGWHKYFKESTTAIVAK